MAAQWGEESSVVVEIRYAAGDGVLLGAGDHWVLVTDPGDDDVLDEIWAVISGARASDAPVTEQVLAIVEKAFAGEPPGLAMVDLSQGGSTSFSRGQGHVRISGADRTLSLGGGADPAEVPRMRRIAGGVVAASRATLSPMSQRTASPKAQVTPPPPAGGPLIDGIPDAILSATGPEGRPPRQRATVEVEYDTTAHVDTSDPDPSFDGPGFDGPGFDGPGFDGPGFDGPGFDDLGPEDAPTTISHPSLLSDPVLGDVDTASAETVNPMAMALGDLGGSTTNPPELAAHMRQDAGDTVFAISCPSGHLTPADANICRVCRSPVAPQEPRLVPRPTLGGLRLPTGEVVPLDRGVVLGRKPAPLDGGGDWPHLVHLPADHTFVSRMHLHIELSGWQVLARDLNSRGGTMITMPGRAPERMRAGEAYVLEPGCTLDLAEVYEVRFEVGPVTAR